MCEINCNDERMLGSCLRNENNKGINYCRQHQDGNDTALCTRFPWQLAMGRWMFHSHSALQWASINQTCIKSTRFLLWAVLRAGFIFLLLYNYGWEAQNNEVTFSGEQTQKLLIHLQRAMPFIQRETEAGEAEAEWKPCPPCRAQTRARLLRLSTALPLALSARKCVAVGAP